MPPRNTATLRSLAAMAGVSAMTVSLALRNHPSIPPATRGRIQTLAAEHGYRPDPKVSQLMRHLRLRRPLRTATTIAVLCRRSGRTGPDNSFDGQLLKGATSQARRLGFTLDLFVLDTPSMSPRLLRRTLDNRGVEAVMLFPMAHPVDLSPLIDWNRFHLVAITSSILGPACHRVIPDQFGNMMMLCRHLWDQGRRRIGLVTLAEHDVRMGHCASGAMAWHNHFVARTPVPPLVTPQWPVESTALRAWLNAHRPDVIVSDDEFDLSRIQAQLKPAERARLPLYCPSLRNSVPLHDGGVYENIQEMGATGVDVLSSLFQNGERGLPADPRTILIPGRLVDGICMKSTGVEPDR